MSAPHDTVALDEGRRTVRDEALGPTLASSEDYNPVQLDAAWLDASSVDRYQAVDTLGEGGMGEVKLCQDRRVGRDVAMKVIRDGQGSTGGSRARFLREARVQGQLEHPAIVPVYDLGVKDDGRAFFTMKRVHGKTLEEILGGLRSGDGETLERYSRRKLLSAFGTVCLAVDFAHSRGVVHRDLKPSNIMFGEFGEVYLLDWGVAKVLGSTDEQPGPARPISVDGAHTMQGELMGTPGFLAPEQARGDVAAVGRSADVFALGAILFELLTLEPLVPITTPLAMITAVLSPLDARASVRVPDAHVPPELEAVCVKATAFSMADRFASAREISDAIESFLDGDRDLEHRRSMARSHVETAAAALAEAGDSTKPSPEARSRAMSALGRALALDPANEDAMRTLVELLTDPPRELPNEAREVMLASRRERLRATGLNASLAQWSLLTFIPFALWMGLRSPRLMVLPMLLFVLAGLHTFVRSRRPPSDGRAPVGSFVFSSLAIGALSTALGPFVLVPAVATVATISYVATTQRSRRKFVTAIGIAAMVVPFALEWFGVLPPSYIFRDGMVSIVPHMVSFPRLPTLAFLLLSNVSTVMIAATVFGRIGDALEGAEERLQLQAWQLRQLMPTSVRGVVSTPPNEPTVTDVLCQASSGWQRWREIRRSRTTLAKPAA